MALEDMMLSEISLLQRDKYRTFPLTGGTWKLTEAGSGWWVPAAGREEQKLGMGTDFQLGKMESSGDGWG